MDGGNAGSAGGPTSSAIGTEGQWTDVDESQVRSHKALPAADESRQQNLTDLHSGAINGSSPLLWAINGACHSSCDAESCGCCEGSLGEREPGCGAAGRGTGEVAWLAWHSTTEQVGRSHRLGMQVWAERERVCVCVCSSVWYCC